jgi:L-ribulose-5-phosphate 3-epimerase
MMEPTPMNPSSIDRRHFLRGVIGGASALALGGRPGFAADVSGKPEAGKVGEFKISLAEWSLHNALRKGEMTNLDFPVVAREKFGIDAVEFVNQFFKDKAQDSSYLKELKKRATDNGVTCVLIMCDGEDRLGSDSLEERTKAVDFHKAWVDAAAELGCHSIRINTGSNYGPNRLETIADGCSKLTEYGVSRNINIIVENHGGPSSDPDALVALMKRVNNPRFGTLPDFGNFPKNRRGIYTIDVYDAIARMMPYARGVSAKSHDFDGGGREANLDFTRILKIVTDAGYHGYVGIEYEGSKLGEPEGIIATRKLLESIRGTNYPG